MRSCDIRIAFATALLAPLFLVGCGDDESNVAQFMASGEGYAEQKQWKEAIIEYKNALQIAPNNGPAHYALAKAYLKSEKLGEAYWELHEAARLDPENTEARLTFGQLNLAARDFDESLAQAEAVIEADPENGSAHVLKGQALEGLDRADESEASYLRAREVDSDKPAYMLVLASYYHRRGKPEQAEPHLVELTEKDPSYVAYTALGRFLARDRERDDEAEAAFRTALEGTEGAQLRAAYRNLAGFHFAKGEFEQAEGVLEEGIDKAEDKLDLIYLLARFHRSQGNTEKADALVEDATRAQPDDPRPYLILSAYRGRQGDLEGALSAAESALEVAPDHQQARLRKSELLVDQGYRESDTVKIAEGRSIVVAVLEREPTNPSALFVRAKIEMAEGDTDAAMTSLRSAIDVKPDWAQAHFVLGSALAINGDPTGARAELARAVELDAGLLEARRLLAQVHASLGEHEYAIEQGRVYLRERPEYVATRILVAQSLVRLGRGGEAMEELSAIPTEDRTAEVEYAMGRLHAARGDYEEARVYLMRADKAKPNHPDVLRTLLGIDRRTGNLAESVRRIETASNEDPGSAKIVVLKGLVAMMVGDLEGAERAFNYATELDPNDLEAYQQLAYFYRLTGQLDKTIETYENASQNRPENARLHHFLGVLYEMDDRPAPAMDRYAQAIELDRGLGEAMNNLAYLLAERGEDMDRALDLAQEAKALLPESPNAADTLGWVLYKRGIPSAAVGYLREAEAGMDPADDTLGIIRHHLAMAYEANGESSKAIDSLERALGTLQKQQEALREAGREVSDPAWAVEVRAMLDRLQAGATG